MGLFGLGKRKITAESIGRSFANATMNADDCWADICKLRSYKTDGVIATCEMAFARAALTKSILCDAVPSGVAVRISAAIDAAVLDSFTGQDTATTDAFYGEALGNAAPKRVAKYLENAFPCAQLASNLGVQLGVSGIPAVEADFMFEAVERRVRKALATVKIV